MPNPILVRARELIADSEHWTRDAYAENNDGSGAYLFDHERPYCMCLVGAVDRAAFELTPNRPADWNQLSEDAKIAWMENHGGASEALKQLQEVTPGLVSDFNDDHEHHEVLELLDEAIAA